MTAALTGGMGTPASSRLRIGVFGRRNAGKSSLVNALAGQEVAVVSDVPGTTTDPVAKSMEILPLGPVLVVDTAGVDDVGDLGRLRVERTRKVLRQTDLAVLVLDSTVEPGPEEEELLEEIRAKKVPVVVALNKIDLVESGLVGGGGNSPGGGDGRRGGTSSGGDGRTVAAARWAQARGLRPIPVSAATGQGLGPLRQAIIASAPADWEGPPIVEGLLGPGELAVLVVPVDLEAPKGRLILPQVQTLRDILDHNAAAVVCKESELSSTLRRLGPSGPNLVVTDSQAFEFVAGVVPPEVPLTSFSILFARRKGDLRTLAEGALAADTLRPGDAVLVAEACTHHPIGDDIGRLKIPRWLQKHVGGPLHFTHSVGGDFPPNLAEYRLVVHCGACMINRKEMLYRLSVAQAAGVPVVNYGVLIAHLHGVLDRALRPFGLELTAPKGASPAAPPQRASASRAAISAAAESAR